MKLHFASLIRQVVSRQTVTTTALTPVARSIRGTPVLRTAAIKKRHLINMWGAFFLVGLASHAIAASLYSPNNFQSLTSDLRARQVGDVITVLIYETASASSSANTSLGRDTNAGFDIRAPGKGFAGGLKLGNSMDGRGSTQREGRVLAQLTVPIKEITEQGDLIIVGEQILEINNEKQQIKVEGRVRPQDVSDANVVLSTRIANAKISYIGSGDLADKQRPTWWQRLLSLFGL